ncbi:YqcI/YcgG family protein [Streptomyces sp. NPDC001941]|uniref:YqcI/YcgG family protein n=1 Tax=Streptomyces sp. NPDC001941 TaxID=3154659 RepID=UPI003323F10B
MPDAVAAQRLTSSGEQVPPGFPDWARQERLRVRATLLAERPAPYPCHFGTIGETGGANHYTYWDLHGEQGREADAVAADLRAFVEHQRERPAERLSLLLLVGPPEPGRDFVWYRSRFWDVLSALHSRDPGPRPEGVPSDPDDPLWEFAFAGEPLFAFGTCPAYGPRRSRALGESLVIGVQCRSVFRTISGATDAGRAAKRRIRRSLAEYEDVPLLSDAGDGLGSTTHKWKQYFPDVDGAPLHGTCPVHREGA